jgi:hypothetical protein
MKRRMDEATSRLTHTLPDPNHLNQFNFNLYSLQII